MKTETAIRRAGGEREAEEALRAFEAATGLTICIKFINTGRAVGGGLGALGERRSLHRSAFCMGVKRTRNEQCKACDLREVPERCERERAVFAHVCHAGAGEVIVPVFSRGVLAAVVYAGQFREGKAGPAGLKRLTAAETGRVKALGRMLGAYLEARLGEAAPGARAGEGRRREAILGFMAARLRENPALADLAAHLGLSSTRTAHVVKERTGMSFVALRDELRLARARSLLAGTYFKVARVAEECGFSSAQYFHRFFRRSTGLTPAAYRRGRQPEV